MSCTTCVITERVFPQEVITSCALLDGYKVQNNGLLKRGWGKSLIISKYRVEVKFIISNSESQTFFEKWYLDELQNGEIDFTINIPIFGVHRDWKMRFVEHYTTDYIAGDNVKVLCKFEVLDNVENYIKQANCSTC